MSVSGFLVSLAAIYEAGAVPADPLALARKCRDYATIASYTEGDVCPFDEPKPETVAVPVLAVPAHPALPALPSPKPQPRRKIF